MQRMYLQKVPLLILFSKPRRTYKLLKERHADNMLSKKKRRVINQNNKNERVKPTCPEIVSSFMIYCI